MTLVGNDVACGAPFPVGRCCLRYELPPIRRAAAGFAGPLPVGSCGCIIVLGVIGPWIAGDRRVDRSAIGCLGIGQKGHLFGTTGRPDTSLG